jgi:hypothetical protein
MTFVRLAQSADAAFLPEIERCRGLAFLAVPGLEWIALARHASARWHPVPAINRTSRKSRHCEEPKATWQSRKALNFLDFWIASLRSQ